jgi:hypothetical protein
MYRLMFVAILGLISGSVVAQINGPDRMLGERSGTGGTNVDLEIDALVKRSGLVSALTLRALGRINDTFRSDASAVAIKAERDAISRLTDPREQQTRAARLFESESAFAAQLAKSTDLSARRAALDPKKKRHLIDGLFDFSIGILQAGPLLTDMQGTMRSASANPMQLTKVMPLLNALQPLQKVVANGNSIIAILTKIAKGADIEVPQATANSKESGGDIEPPEPLAPTKNLDLSVLISDAMAAR